MTTMKLFEFDSSFNQNRWNRSMLKAEMRSDLAELNRSPYFKNPEETYDPRQIVDLIDNAVNVTEEFFARYRKRKR